MAEEKLVSWRELDVSEANIEGGSPLTDACYPNGFAHALNMNGALEFNFDVDFEVDNQLFIHHISSVDRIADVTVNEISVNDFVFNDTGKPCWDGGSPRYNMVESSSLLIPKMLRIELPLQPMVMIPDQ